MSDISDKPRRRRRDAVPHADPEIARIGMEIRDARLSAGMTQEELAMASGVGRDLIVQLEKGAHGAAIGKVIRVLAALGKRIGFRDT